MRSCFKLLIVIVLSVNVSALGYSQGKMDITSVLLREHVEYLASQELGGRYPGTAGDLGAAAYIRDRFREYGLELYNQSGFQTFGVKTGIRKGTGNSLVLNGHPATPDQDFIPLSISDNGLVSGELVFTGFGFRIQSESIVWDDYKDVDVRGKVVLILLGAPDPPQGVENDPFEDHGAIRSKLLNARDLGASAVVLVAGPAYDEKDELDFGTIRENPAGLPVIRVRRSFIKKALAGVDFNADELEPALNAGKKSLSKSLGVTISLQTDIITDVANTSNVVAWIPAQDTGSRHEWVVVGAHFDHLGTGGPGSNSRVQDTTGVHPGADDNASGVASIIEIAHYLKSRKTALHRSVMFVAFTGEEMGLLGSKYFVENPPVSPGRISAMINLDMVGRLNEERRLSVTGTGTAAEMDSLIETIDQRGLNYVKSPEGYGPSDHASFYSAGIPVLYFSTGAHLDYHTPFDIPDKLNYDAMALIATQIAGMITSIACMPASLTFREAGPRANDSGRRKLKVTFGLMPDVSGAENNGLRVEFVTPGKPAYLAGILKGDRIVGINGMAVTNVYDYMGRLQQLKPGQTVSVELIRDEKKMLVLVQL